MKTGRWLIAAGALAACLGAASQSRGEERITAFVETNGKLIFTNLATYTPSALATAPASQAARLGGSIETLIDGISARHGVDATLVRAVIEVESSFDRHAVSPKGALGLMQLIPATGSRFGVRDFFDPAQNVEGGVRYLRFLLEKFQGNLDLSLAAYNAGENRVEGLGRVPAIPETQDYVRKVRAAYGRMRGSGTYRPVATVGSPGQMPDSSLGIASGAGPERSQTVIYRTMDDRGIMLFSNMDPVQ